MDERQIKSVEMYSLIAKTSNNMAALAGRHEIDQGKEPLIWNDIISKLPVKPNINVLDLGGGCGGLTELSLKASIEIDFNLYLYDIPEVINKARGVFSDDLFKNCQLYSGIFPHDHLASLQKVEFDAILAYSVFQHTDEPRKFIDEASKLLKTGGRMLIGDIPNVNKKGRFLSCDSGRKFEAEYKNIDIYEVPFYKNHHDFLEKSTGQNKTINDEFLLSIIQDYRNNGYNAYIIPQPSTLPFSFTREDLVIEKL